MHAEGLRCFPSSRDRVAQSYVSVTGLESQHDLSGRDHLSPQPFFPEKVIFLVILAMVDRTKLSPDMCCDSC